MKRIWSFALAACLLAVCLSGCGSSGGKTEQVDLSAFYTQTAEQYDWDETYMMDLTDDLLDSYYPGLKELATVQLVAKMPQISSVVNELVLVECASEEDAAAAAEILQKRIDDQAAGGAWYPESMASWEKAKVYTDGAYAAMIASAEHQAEIGEAFTALFQ